jgi:hypothetical protein
MIILNKEEVMKESFKWVQGSIPEIILNEKGLYEGDLKYYFRVVFEKAKNVSNPYHNFRHMMHVLFLCYDAAQFYKKKLSKRDIRNLFIAAMFHDFDHPGKNKDDKVNVAIAVKGFKKWILPKDRKYKDEIIDLIEATIYPFSHNLKNLSLSKQILQDSDLCQVFSVVWIQQVVFGFAGESGNPAIDFLKMQEKFIKNIKFHSDWAKKRFESSKKDKIKEVRALLKILNA